jgi:hypothetical protein
MNPESPIPQPAPENACGVSPQTVQGASRSESILPNPHPPSATHPSFDDMGFVYPPEMSAEPDYDGDSDYENDARERELLMDDLASDNDDFARSDDEGWYYSDEN